MRFITFSLFCYRIHPGYLITHSVIMSPLGCESFLDFCCFWWHWQFWGVLVMYSVRASLLAQMVRNLPAVRETWVWSLGQEIPWRREWQPISSVHGESHEQRSLTGYSPWGHKESDTTELLTLSLSFYEIFCNLDLFEVYPMIRLGLWVFGKEVSQVRCHYHHVLSRVHTIDMVYHCGWWSGSPNCGGVWPAYLL